MDSAYGLLRFPKGFFVEETREDFSVPEMMKRAWAAQMEVLEVVARCCSKLGIKYYVAYGTLLGAVRHKGFIPWDDDIDICMFRADYDRFVNEGPSVLPEGFVISGVYGVDERLWQANTQPQSRVIADESYWSLPRYMNYFHGYPYMRIGIDIFPWDYLPEDPQKQLELIEQINEIQRTAANLDHYRNNNLLNDRIKRFEDMTDMTIATPDDIYLAHNLRLAVEKLISIKDTCKTENVADILYLEVPEDTRGFTGYKGVNVNDMGDGILLQFENIQVNAPVHPTAVLESWYGDDYMIYKKFTSYHNYPIYRTQQEAFSELLKQSGVSTSVDEFCRNWHELNGGT